MATPTITKPPNAKAEWPANGSPTEPRPGGALMVDTTTTHAHAEVSTVKDHVRDAIYEQRDQFVQLAHAIHEHPELAFGEEYAVAHLTEFLADAGFNVRFGVAG